MDRHPADRPTPATPAGGAEQVCLGAVAAAHGIRGEVKLKAFTEDPLDIGAYGPVTTTSGRVLKLSGLRVQGGAVIARIQGISDRNAAEALRGQRLYVPRSALPATEDEDEFYHADLIGLTVEDEAGFVIGTVLAVQNFGGGDVLDIGFPAGGSAYLLFTREMVPVVDIKGRRVVIAPPADWRDETAPEEGEGDQGRAS